MNRDWRDTLRAAADLALLGILLTLACLPVVTAGAAVSTASAAVHHFAANGGWPRAVDIGRTFVRGLVPGIGATAVALGAAALFALDLAGLRSGAVPGGRPLLVLTGVLGLTAAGFAGLVVVLLPRRAGGGWREAVRAAAALVTARPSALAAAAGVVALAAGLAVLLHPVVTPILAGYALYAGYAVVYGRSPTGRVAPIVTSGADPFGTGAEVTTRMPSHGA